MEEMDVTCTASLSEACTRCLQQPLIKTREQLLQNFPQQSFKRTHLLNGSQRVLWDLGNMEGVLINPPASAIRQISFARLPSGQVTVLTGDLLLRSVSLGLAQRQLQHVLMLELR